MKRALCLVGSLLLALGSAAMAQTPPEGRLMRFPDIYKDKIAFSYAGDLWLVSAQGGVARRLTTSPGLELFPKFSPDGTQIAFTAQYDGNFNVYVMPSEGGQPKQLTFNPGMPGIPERMGVENEVITWFPDGKRILFLSRRDTFNSWFGRLFSVSVDGGLPERLPIDKGGLTSFSPDGSKIAYNRIFRNFRTWKRYTGGMAQDIWIYDFKQNQIQQITHYPGTDTYPMWHGDTIYFGSDRGPDHRINLYSYSLKTKQIRQLTHFTDFDVEWPSLGPDSIVFEDGGYLYVFDLKSEKAHKLTIEVPGDFVEARKHWVSTSKLITDFDISPDGQRAVFTARGDVFTVPAKQGSTRDITQTPGAREKYATWSPDGKWIAYVSDESGEDELYIRPQDGLGKEIRITTDGKVYRYAPVWSPDSKKLAFSDKSLRLFYVDISAKQPVLIDQGKYDEIHDYNWSPDSQWVAYAKAAENDNQVIYLYSLATRKMTPVTTSFTNSYDPVFDPAGDYLYFLSDRDYNETLGRYDFEFSNPKTARGYAVTLRANLPSPFAPRSDEVKAGKTSPSATASAGNAPAAKPAKPEAPFRIDLDGITDRVVGFPMPPANIGQLSAGKRAVYYSTLPIFGLSGPLPGEPPAIHAFTLKDRKDHVLIIGANRFALSFDGTKLLYVVQGKPVPGQPGPPLKTYGIIRATPVPKMPHKVGDGRLNLANMKMRVDPPAEWKQIFYEVWRQERDFFYEKSMNGVDWAKVRDQYAQLLPYVKDRFDLTYILGNVISELANSHTYVGGGDHPNLHPVNDGLLGVDFEVDTAHGLYRFKKIYQGQNWDPGLRSPLTEPGVDVKQGDYLLAVNGKPLRVPQNPYELFVNTANQNTTLSVSSQPDPSTGRNVVVKPLTSEFSLRELDMIRTNRKKVDAATGGKVGYVYLPDMEGAGLNEFVKQFFPQIRKQGLIIDVRYNGGGFVDQIIFERLRRVLAAMMSARNWKSGTVPDLVFNGYLACVTNHYAASDGDFFTYFFKKYKLGPVIGTRTWGGVRGIRGGMPLIDGGYITRPEFSLYGLNSQWIIENHGVQPDMVVDNRPDLVMSGHDPQLEKAIQVLMNEIRQHPKTLPHRPPDLPAYPPGPGW
ncbi:MAG TPA: PDZ domain-containing protein [Terriglobia bacterium]|nr:PDZ domain-containing protein [Terriglobia bacterium]